MFSTTINCIVLKVPAKQFNNNPIETLKSYIGYYNEVACYEVSNTIDSDLMLTVVIYYKSLDTSKIYYVRPSELQETKLINRVTPTYISDLVTMIIPSSIKTPIVPIEVKTKDNPDKAPDGMVLSNYFARPLNTPFKFFTSITPFKLSHFKQYFLFPKSPKDASKTIL